MRSFLFTHFLCLLFVIPLAGQTVYFSSNTGELYELDLTDCSLNFIHDFGVPVFDIAAHPDGRIYFVYSIDEFSSALGFYDPLTNQQSILTEIQLTNNLVAGSDGLLYYVADGRVYSFDPANEALNNLAPNETGSQGDLTFFNGELYITGFPNGLFRILPYTSGQPPLIDFPEDVSELYGVTSVFSECARPRYFVSSQIDSGEMTVVLEIDLINITYSPICTLDIGVTGASSPTEFLAQERIRIESLVVAQPDCGTNDGRIAIEACGLYNPISYSLNGGPANSTGIFENLPGREYTITISDNLGFSIQVDTNLSQSLQFALEQISIDPADCLAENGSVTIVTNPANSEFSLALNSFPVDDLNGLPAATYMVSIFDTANCQVDTTLVVPQGSCPLYFPTAFSPNFDGVNDVFRPEAANGASAQIISFRVFSRWGDLLFESENFTFISGSSTGWWDGTSAGKPLNNGTYLFTAEVDFLNGEIVPYAGQVQLVR